MTAAPAAARLHRVTRPELEVLVGEALDRARPGDAPVVLVRADPATVPDLASVHGRPVVVRGTTSPLEVRALIRRHTTGSGAGSDGGADGADRGVPLVVLTDADDRDLGVDVLARAVRRKVIAPNRWSLVCEMFRAKRPSPALARQPALVDALVAAQPVGGYPRVTSPVLDLDTATAALVREHLGISDDVIDLTGFLEWVGRPEAAGRIVHGRALLEQEGGPVAPMLRARFGPGVDAVLAALTAGHADDLVPLGIVAGILHHRDGPGGHDTGYLEARGGLRRLLGGPDLAPEAHRDWGAAAERLLLRAEDGARLQGRAQRWLTDLGGADAAHLSDVLPLGFAQRIHHGAAALTAWWRARVAGGQDVASPARAADDAIRRVRSHRGHLDAPERLDRLQMVARLVRRPDLALDRPGDLADLAAAYVRDGAWLDAARTAISRGDGDPTLDALCTELAALADEARHAGGARIAQVLARAAAPLPDSLLGVEDVLDRVVAPLAAARPVLVLVLDGLGWPTFTEIAPRLEERGWEPWHRPDRPDRPEGQVAVAALPTVTEVSRTSLLAGTRRAGDGDSEARAFAAHPAVRGGASAAAGGAGGQLLFHKRDLRAGGLDTRARDLLDAVADTGRHVVGAVLNNVDERLKDVPHPRTGWGWNELDPLGDVLDAADAAGRVVVLTADHGHILDRDPQVGPSTGGGGERWRPTGPPPAPGEIEVHGPRVVSGGGVAGGRVVLPLWEQMRYGPRQNGYHGGLTPQELLVPLVVLAPTARPLDRDLAGWAPTGIRPPAWWHRTPLPAASRGPVPAAPPGPAAGTAPAATAGGAGRTPTLFDLPEPESARAPGPEPAPASAPAPDGAAPDGAPDAPAQPGWIDELWRSEAFARRRRNPRIRVGDDELRRLLTVLDAMGDMGFPESRLAEEAGLPRARIGRYIAQLQDLLNVDGYAVVSAVDGQVRFDLGLLRTQLL